MALKELAGHTILHTNLKAMSKKLALLGAVLVYVPGISNSAGRGRGWQYGAWC
jgi:hypothetical protein